MKTSSHLGWLWLLACPPRHLCRLLLHLTGSSGSLVGVLVHLFLVHGCRGGHSLGLCPHVVTGIHLPARHWQHTASRGRRLLGGRCHGTVPWWDTLCPRKVEKFFSRGPLGLWLHLLGCLDYDPPCWLHGRRVYIIDFRSLAGGVILQFRQ